MTILFIALLAAGLFLLWKGYKTGSARNRELRERELLEDALKNLYGFESRKVPCKINDLSECLSLNDEKLSALIANLEGMDLVFAEKGEIKLTPEGRAYALKIIRIHRLWELYLSDRTSVKESKWHVEAEKKEHLISEEEANILAAQLGNPLVDPHGDPIPNEKGKFPVKQGMPLTDLKPGKLGKIFHIEDEPEIVYSQLVAEGLYPGMQVKIIEADEYKIRFEADGTDCVLSPRLAENVTVEEIKDNRELRKYYQSLSSLEIGDEAEIAEISKALRGQQRRRLMDFGVVAGTKIKAQMKGIGGDPTAYEVRGTTVAFRKDQAALIYVKNVRRKNASNAM